MSRTLSLAVLVSLTNAQPSRAQDAPAAESGERSAPVDVTGATVAPTAPIAADEVHVLRVGPGCMGSQWNSVNVAGALFDPMARSGSYVITSVSESAIERGTTWLFPDASAPSDTAKVVRIVDGAAEGLAEGTGASGAGRANGALKREVLDDALPVLIGPQDMAFQWPRLAHIDALAIIEDEAAHTGKLPDLRRVQARLVRYTRGDVTVLGVELPDGADAAGESPRASSDVVDDGSSIASWERRVFVTGVVRAGDDEVSLYAFGRKIGGGARLKAAIEGVLQRATAARTVVVHMGNVAGELDDTEGRAQCLADLAALHLDAVVPRARDIALGVKGLAEMKEAGKLPFVAANLTDKDGKHPFPRSIVVEREGLTIAIVGVLNPVALDVIPSTVRGEWRIAPAPRAIEDALWALHDKLRRFPDLTVVVGAYSPQEIQAVFATPHVDVVMSDEGNDIIARTTRTTIDEVRGGREQQRGQSVSLVAASPSFALSHVTARFAPTSSPSSSSSPSSAGEQRRRLVELEHSMTPLVDGMAKDEALSLRHRKLEEKKIASGSVILIPDPDAFIRAHAELAPAVWGEHVLYLGEYKRLDKSWSPFVTDQLWMNLVVNTVKQSAHTDVVLARNIERGDDVLGPIPRFVVDNWLATPESIVTTTLTGDELLKIAARINKQTNGPGEIAPLDYVFAAGLDAHHNRIGGRAINPAERYSVAYTEGVALLADVQDVLRNHEAVRGEGVRDIVLRRLTDGVRDDASLNALFLDHSDDLEVKVTAGFEELSLQGLAFRNSDNVGLYAASRETRLSNPNLYQIAVRANGFVLYDGPWIANEWRLKMQLDSIVFDIPGAVIPPQEQRDDIVASTEVRINKVKVGIADDDFQVIPFVQAAFDTEATPTVDPVDPTKTLAHQLVLRESGGLVAYPGPLFRELRLGALVQQDFSESPGGGRVFNDFGVVAAYKIRVPLFWQLLYDSELDLRYLVPDADDRPSDLGLRVQSTHKIVLPLSQSIAFFVFVDAFVVTGKTATNSELGGNGILGAGMQFADMLKL